ncbi:MAG: ABC transporter ATP-binding protein [Nitrospinota bacterium]|nr:ABC transporter ATP-binding protein [Nitrospinota bacterium]MDH5757220.1 ABC transporter ATP-binding protein [Nitrospinota bacterium]
MEEEIIVEAIGLSRRFTLEGRVVVALGEVDLSVRRGEVLGIVGSSGAGKSTLLQLLGALDRPTGGTVLYEGVDIFKLQEAELALFRSRKVGFVFQSSNLLPEFTAEENVAIAGMIAGKSKRHSLESARESLKAMGLSKRLNHRPGKLSGGEQQRVAIARALVNEPALVLADEPTGNLDTTTGEEIVELLFRLNRENNQTFVIVTHNMDLAARMSRTTRIRDGAIMEAQSMAD